ncbi:glycosyltransferase family 4 protein [Streptomyces sp. NPDC047315]|uniref:glycosyltransferase family 4 protein n=1 Tax=Streptomyces sp. NPDC047315 TaxID=3155142 RepID=UPI0033CE463C
MIDLRVVARVHAYPPQHNAGAEWMLHEMLRSLVARGHSCEVWLSQWTGETEARDVDGVHVVPAGLGEWQPAVAAASVVVSHLECVPETASLARGYGVPMVVLCHNTFDLTWKPIMEGTTALAVVNSQWMREAAGRAFDQQQGHVPQRMLVVRPPVHPGDYQTRPGDCITLINCTLSKGAGVLAAVAERMPDRKFLAVRGGYGEQQPPDLPNVLVLDHMDGHRMRDEVYARTRILLMPSDYESWGRAGVEAMASGIPVIAHPTDGLVESLGPAGTFADRGDVDAWQHAIEALDETAAYRAASRKARARSRALDPTDDLAAWCDAVEEVARARTAPR